MVQTQKKGSNEDDSKKRDKDGYHPSLIQHSVIDQHNPYHRTELKSVEQLPLTRENLLKLALTQTDTNTVPRSINQQTIRKYDSHQKIFCRHSYDYHKRIRRRYPWQSPDIRLAPISEAGHSV